MTDPREVLANSLVILVSVTVVFAGLEAAIAVGLVTSDASYPRYTWCEGPDQRGQFHPVYGVTAVPNQTYLEKRSPATQWTLHRINANGFRDTYDSGNRTAIVLGDSFTNGVLADDNATYPHLLDRWTPNVGFLNYGHGGYSTAQELLVYERASAEHPHDVVIVGYYFGNDMHENVENRPTRPRFVVRNGSLHQVRPPYDERRARQEIAAGPIQSGPAAALKQFLVDNTESYLFLAPKIGAVLQAVGVLERNDPTPPTGEELDRELRVTRLLLERIADEAARNDATLLVVGIPARGEVNPDNPHFYSHAEAERYSDRQRRMIRRVVDDRPDAHYLDLKPTLVDRYERGRQVYGSDNAHMTEYGYRVTARTIYRWLVDHGELERDPTVDLAKQYDRDIASCP